MSHLLFLNYVIQLSSRFDKTTLWMIVLGYIILAVAILICSIFISVKMKYDGSRKNHSLQAACLS